MGQYFIFVNRQHVKNKHLRISKGQNYDIEMVCFGGVQAKVHLVHGPFLASKIGSTFHKI